MEREREDGPVPMQHTTLWPFSHYSFRIRFINAGSRSNASQTYPVGKKEREALTYISGWSYR